MEAVLDQRTLVLNRSWVAIDTTTVRKALVWMYRGLARAIAPESFETHDFASWTDLSVSHGEPCIHTINLQIRVPEIIILALNNEVPKKEVVFSRRNIYKRPLHVPVLRRTARQRGVDDRSHPAAGERRQVVLGNWVCWPASSATGRRRTDAGGGGDVVKKAAVRPPWTPFISLKLGTRRASWERFRASGTGTSSSKSRKRIERNTTRPGGEPGRFICRRARTLRTASQNVSAAARPAARDPAGPWPRGSR